MHVAIQGWGIACGNPGMWNRKLDENSKAMNNKFMSASTSHVSPAITIRQLLFKNYLGCRTGIQTLS